jgi:hypothetical protein
MARKGKSNKVTRTGDKIVNAITQSVTQKPLRNTHALLGYRHPQTTEIIATPAVARAVKAGLVRRLVAEAAPQSLGLLMRMVDRGHAAMDLGESATPLQVDAAKHLTNLAGLQAIAEEKDVAEMSDNELKQLLEQVSAEATKRQAVDVDGTVSAPSDAPAEGQAVDTVDSLFS